MNRSSYSFTLELDEELTSDAPLRFAHRFTVLPTLRKSVQALDAALDAGGDAGGDAAAEDTAASSFMRAARAFASTDADAVSVSEALHALGTASIGLEAGTRDGGLGTAASTSFSATASSSSGSASGSASPGDAAEASQCELIFPTELILHLRGSAKVSLAFELPGTFTARHAGGCAAGSTVAAPLRSAPGVPVLRVESERARAALGMRSLRPLPVLQGGDVDIDIGGGAPDKAQPDAAQLGRMTRHPIAVAIETGAVEMIDAALHVELLKSSNAGSSAGESAAFVHFIAFRRIGGEGGGKDGVLPGGAAWRSNELIALHSDGRSGRIALPASLPANSTFEVVLSVQFPRCRAYRVEARASYVGVGLHFVPSVSAAFRRSQRACCEVLTPPPPLQPTNTRTHAQIIKLAQQVPNSANGRARRAESQMACGECLGRRSHFDASLARALDRKCEH